MSHPQDVAVPVPFYSRLVHGLEAGQTLFVHGNVNAAAEKFEVNLLSGSNTINPELGNVALHVNVRFHEGKIVLNSLQGGQWGKEKRVSNPFKPDQPFDIRIRVHDDRFEVLANQKEVAEFEHRINFTSIDNIEVRGDISLTGLHWGGRYFDIPFETSFHDGHLKNNDRILIYGIPKGDRFEVNLVNRAGDVAFHYNPRFGEKKVVRNACVGGQWGAEEREGPFPYKKDIAFDLIIHNAPYSIQIFVNSERVGTFAHRIQDPSQDYARLRIAGDIELTGVEFSH